MQIRVEVRIGVVGWWVLWQFCGGFSPWFVPWVFFFFFWWLGVEVVVGGDGCGNGCGRG